MPLPLVSPGRPSIHSQNFAEPASLPTSSSPVGRSSASSLLNSPREMTSGRLTTRGPALRGQDVALSSDSQVGVVQYGEDVVHEFHLNDYRSVKDVAEAASHIEQRGGTETQTAFGIEFAR